MNKLELEDLGDRIQEVIEHAISSQDYKKLNQSVGEVLNRTFGQVRQEMNGQHSKVKEQRKTQENQEHFQQETHPNLYGHLTGERVKRILQIVFGGILLGSMGIGLFVVAILEIFIKHSIISLLGPAVFMGILFMTGAYLLWRGCRGLSLLSRFKTYTKKIGKNTYCMLQDLSRASGKTLKFVKKDVKRMINKGWFLEGHLDRQETCLIISHETYEQYEQTQLQLEQRQKEARQEYNRSLENEEKISDEVRGVLEKGNAYLKKIRQSNDAIPGMEISAKISKMEMIVEQIFKRAKEHPDIIPDLKRMMDYYLPMTVKLLDAYEEMDSQPVQGTNIQSSKKEIEDTLDTLNEAFAKLLDSVFKDTAWDVSSDISVLHTMLAQEGLTKNDFTL